MNRCHQLVAFEVRQTAECHIAAEVLIAVGVASRTAQRTFFGDFNGEIGTMTSKDSAPRLDDLACADGGFAHVASIIGYSVAHAS
jgi:hypothetical protein